MSYAYNLRYHSIFSIQLPKFDNNQHYQPIPDAIRSPGYPFFLSIFVDQFPNSTVLDRILTAQLIISILTIIIALLFYIYMLPKPFAILSALLVSVSPHLISMTTYVLTETLFTFLMLIYTCTLVVFVEKPKTLTMFLSGITLGIANSIRSSPKYLPVILIFFFITHYGKKKGIYYFTIMLLGFWLVCIPWIIRNIVSVKAIGDPRLQISFLTHAMYPDFKYNNDPKTFGFPYKFDPRYPEIAQSTISALKEIVNRFMREPFVYFKWYLCKKPIVFWSWNSIQGAGDVFIYPVKASPYFDQTIFYYTHQLMKYIHWPIVFLACIGSLWVWFPLQLPSSRHQDLIIRLISLILIYFTLLHMIGAPFPRYSIPIRPFLYSMAMYTLFKLKTIQKKFKAA
ncbi:MAG: glycosyltransferase family 39 protein [Desulfobacterales bacterium]|nr:glycosyltransferase family 39 protein [Desulfobacterales bacterium]